MMEDGSVIGRLEAAIRLMKNGELDSALKNVRLAEEWICRAIREGDRDSLSTLTSLDEP